MIKLIVFDWDDVIILGSKAGYYKCYKETLKELGVVLDEKEIDIRIKRKWGQPFKEELRELLKEDPSLLDKAVDIYYHTKFHGPTFINQLSEVSGVNELLLRLSKKYKLAVATGNQKQLLFNKIIPKFKIPDVFCQIVTVYDDIPPEKTKPHPYMLELIMKNLNILPSETVYVGDAKTDVQMASSAKVTPIVVLTGHLSRNEALELKVKYIIDNVNLIEDILDKI